jgi:hypothetical protein
MTMNCNNLTSRSAIRNIAVSAVGEQAGRLCYIGAESITCNIAVSAVEEQAGRLCYVIGQKVI